MPYPKAIANAPALRMEDVFYFNAYQDLCTCRPYEGGYVPWTAIREYALYCGYDDEEFSDLRTIILSLDNLLRADAIKKQDKGDRIGR